MVVVFIILLALLTLAIDYGILHLWRREGRSRWLRRGYVVVNGLLYVAIFAALVLYRDVSGGDEALMRTTLWMFFLFFITAAPKLLLTLFGVLRRVYRRQTGRKGRGILYTGVALTAALVILMTWSATGGRTQIRTVEVTVASPKIPVAFDGYRIVLFSDLHVGNQPANGRMIYRLAERINALHPDLVVNAGDLINIRPEELTPQVLEALEGIKATDGVVSVLGNHDLGIYINRHRGTTPRQCVARVTEAERALGWSVLQNQTKYLYRSGDSLAVSGVNFPAEGRTHGSWKADFSKSDFDAAWRGVPDSLFNLLVMHSPELWDAAREGAYADLTLSGHVHAMQLKLKLGRWAWSPARWMYRRWSGLYREADKSLYINDGIGYVLYPMRVGTRPELTLITLRHSRVMDARVK